MNCSNCKDNESKYDLILNEESVHLCEECRKNLINNLKNPIGRKKLGITKKVSLTLNKNVWEWIDVRSKGNKSSFLRSVITDYEEGNVINREEFYQLLEEITNEENKAIINSVIKEVENRKRNV